MKFFMRNPHTNIILIKASHRFNLDDFYVWIKLEYSIGN
jgi:hypothetical protein